MLRRALPLISPLANQCAVCLSWPADRVCSACVARFSPTIRRCPACAIALVGDLATPPRSGPELCLACIRQWPPVDLSLVAVNYAWPWSELIARFKFGGKPAWASFFATRLAEAPGVMLALAALRKGDLIVPMPLSLERLEFRGFNQSWELARALHGHAPRGVIADPQLLLRIRNTRPQIELQREERIANVKGAFAIDPLRASVLMGKRMVIVDDVMTSGASLFAAAEALRAAGATHITAIAFARTAAD